MTRYSPARSYLWAGIAASVLAVCSGWYALNWAPSVIPAALFLISAILLGFFASRPSIEIHDDYVCIGKDQIQWAEISHLDCTGWHSPLVVRLTISNDNSLLLIYPGDLDSSNSLLRQLRRLAVNALIDGIPYKQFWGEAPPVLAERVKAPSPRYRLLRKEDEAEVERLYQRLKTVGRLDSTNTSDEN